MASLGTKKIRADQVLGPGFLVSLTVSSLSIDRYSFQQSFKCNTYGGQKCVKIEQVPGSIGTKEPQTGTTYYAILIGLKSSNNLRWLNISIKIGTNQFWWAPRIYRQALSMTQMFPVTIFTSKLSLSNYSGSTLLLRWDKVPCSWYKSVSLGNLMAKSKFFIFLTH